MRITFILPVISHAYSQTRIEHLEKEGVEPVILGFERKHYKGKAWKKKVINLGFVEHGNYFKRFFPDVKALFPVWKHSKTSDFIYCFNLETLLIGWFANIFRFSKAKLIYDVADIQQILMSKSATGKILRFFEKLILNNVSVVVVTSPSYISGYFHQVQKLRDVNYHIIENKLPANISNPENNKPVKTSNLLNKDHSVIRIGYFGGIRCNHSLVLLNKVLERGQGKFRLYLRGIFSTQNIDEKLKNKILSSKYVDYDGPYVYPDDLSGMYEKIDISWVAFYHAENNVKWSRATRFYQACYYRSPLIVQYNTQDAKVVKKRNYGLLLDITDIESSLKKILRINPNDISNWKQNLTSIPREEVVYTNEHKKLFEVLKKDISIHKNPGTDNFIKRIGKYYRTLSHLKGQQIFFQIYYRIIRKKRLVRANKIPSSNTSLDFFQVDQIFSFAEYQNKKITFSFLNQEKVFKTDAVDWSDEDFGKLWNYNLQYVYYANQSSLPLALRSKLICDLYSWLYEGKITPESYPATLRIMNIIRFLNLNSTNIEDFENIIRGVYSDLHFLGNNVEYHLLANHLFENACALLMGGYYFNEKNWIQKAEKILTKELDEQFLSDGAHFERSMMYHQLMLFRLLEAIQYLPEYSEIKIKMISVCEKMFSWMNQMTFQNGTPAHFNDSTNGIAPRNSILSEIATSLGVDIRNKLPLSESGFRKFENKTFELIADVHGISPEYQPGHAHADTHSFILHVNNTPIIVDPSISTYNKGQKRDHERSTVLHNTVTVNDMNTAEVWEGFRVGRRPEVKILEEYNHSVTSELTYKSSIEFRHKRCFILNSNHLKITDFTNQKNCVARFHIAPGIQIKKTSPGIFELNNHVRISFSENLEIELFKYQFNIGFNRSITASGLKVHFDKTLESNIIELTEK